MGICQQGVFGNFRGKVGNVVGRVRQGRNVYAIYQPVVNNPQTADQMATRSNFTLLSKFMSKCITAVRIGFKYLDGYKYGSAYSSAVGYNLKINGIINSGAIDFTKVVMSEGALDALLNLTEQNDSGTITLTWTDTTGLGNAKADDIVYVVAYNKDLGVCIVDNSAERGDRNATVTCPTPWAGNTVEFWAFCESADGRYVSTSQYLGNEVM